MAYNLEGMKKESISLWDGRSIILIIDVIHHLMDVFAIMLWFPMGILTIANNIPAFDTLGKKREKIEVWMMGFVKSL